MYPNHIKTYQTHGDGEFSWRTDGSHFGIMEGDLFPTLSLSSLWHLKTARSAKPGVATPTAPGSLGGESLSFQRKNEWHVC